MTSTPIPTPYDIVPIAPVAYSLSIWDWLLLAIAIGLLILLTNWLVRARAARSLDSVVSLVLQQLEAMRSSGKVDGTELNALLRRYLSSAIRLAGHSQMDVMGLSARELEALHSCEPVLVGQNELIAILVGLEQRRFASVGLLQSELEVALQQSLEIFRSLREQELSAGSSTKGQPTVAGGQV